jgi:hypothetical protein
MLAAMSAVHSLAEPDVYSHLAVYPVLHADKVSGSFVRTLRVPDRSTQPGPSPARSCRRR